MEEDRRCQERYEAEMHKLEEERKAKQKPQELHKVTSQKMSCEEITCETTKNGGESVELLVEKVLDNVPLPQEQETETTKKGGYAQTSELTAENIYDTDLKKYNEAGPNYKSPQEARLAKRALGDRNCNSNHKKIVSCGTEEDGKLETTASVETIIDTDLRIFNEQHFSDKTHRDIPPLQSNESMKCNRSSSSPQDILEVCEKCGDKITKATGETGQRMSPAKGPLATKEDDLHHINDKLNPECDMELLINANETMCPVNCSEEALYALTHNGEVEGDDQVGKADVVASSSYFDHQRPQEGFEGSELYTYKAKGPEEEEEVVQKGYGGRPGLETLQLPEPYKGRMGAGSRLMVEVCMCFLAPLPICKALRHTVNYNKSGVVRF